MGYTKFINYGDNFEIYNYEKQIDFVRTSRILKRFIKVQNPCDGGTDALQKRQLGKRQDNAQRIRLVFRRLVICNLSESSRPLLITLTYKENEQDISRGYRDFTSFVQALRYKYGNKFSYICVPEFQRRGAIHFHALFWSLPEKLFVEERSTRTLAKLWGHGFLFLKQTDGNEKIAGYLSKYMAKAFTDPRLKNKKAYVSSRNINRPNFGGSNYHTIQYAIDDFIGVDNFAVQSRVYMTQWLGSCKYQLFKIKK